MNTTIISRPLRIHDCIHAAFQSVRTTPSNEAVTIDFKAVTLKAGENRYTKVASISFDGKLSFTSVLLLGRSQEVSLTLTCDVVIHKSSAESAVSSS